MGKTRGYLVLAKYKHDGTIKRALIENDCHSPTQRIDEDLYFVCSVDANTLEPVPFHLEGPMSFLAEPKFLRLMMLALGDVVESGLNQKQMSLLREHLSHKIYSALYREVYEHSLTVLRILEREEYERNRDKNYSGLMEFYYECSKAFAILLDQGLANDQLDNLRKQYPNIEVPPVPEH